MDGKRIEEYENVRTGETLKVKVSPVFFAAKRIKIHFAFYLRGPVEERAISKGSYSILFT